MACSHPAPPARGDQSTYSSTGAYWMAPISIPNDIRQQTIYTIVSKPVRRLELIWGRIFGYMGLVTVLLLLFGGISLLYYHRQVTAAIREQVEIRIKYAGYIERQQKDVEQFRKLEARPLPAGLDYDSVPSLRIEARQKLKAVRPLNFGQAGRISGVSPADITALIIYMENKK